MSIGTSSVPSSRPRTPNLHDPARFVCVNRVPIVDVLKRDVIKHTPDGQPYRVTEQIDENQLKRILRNSRLRARRGEFGIVFLGHTDDDGPETSQPPVVGYLDDYEEGVHEGTPTILASMYIDKSACSDVVLHGKPLDPEAVLRQFPRRSAEIMGIEEPHAFIDSVGLLKRTPERMLGYVSNFSNSRFSLITRFECPGGCHMPTSAGRTGKTRKTLAKRALALVGELVQDIIDGDQYAPGDEDNDGQPFEGEETPQEELSEHGPADQEQELPPLGDEDGYGPEPEAGLEAEDEGMEEPLPEHDEEPEHLCAACQGTGRANEGEAPRRPERFATQEPDEAVRLEAGAAGPYTAIPGISMKKPPKPKPTGTPAATRMRQDSGRISISRFQQTIDAQAQQIAQLTERLNSADRRAEEATVEQQVIQLEAEGYILDRPTEVARLSALTSDARSAEIARMRKYQSRSPVAQAPMPNVWGDPGGASLPRPQTIADLDRLSDEDVSAGGIRGLSAARFAASLESDPEFRRTTGLDRGVMAISRMQAARKSN